MPHPQIRAGHGDSLGRGMRRTVRLGQIGFRGRPPHRRRLHHRTLPPRDGVVRGGGGARRHAAIARSTSAAHVRPAHHGKAPCTPTLRPPHVRPSAAVGSRFSVPSPRRFWLRPPRRRTATTSISTAPRWSRRRRRSPRAAARRADTYARINGHGVEVHPTSGGYVPVGAWGVTAVYPPSGTVVPEQRRHLVELRAERERPVRLVPDRRDRPVLARAEQGDRRRLQRAHLAELDGRRPGLP